MRVAIRLFAGFLLLIIASTVFGSSPTVGAKSRKEFSLGEYRTELLRIQSDVAALKDHPEQVVPIFDSIADEFQVTVDSRQYLIDNKLFKQSIGEYKIATADRRGKLLTAINSRLNTLIQDADQFATPPGTQGVRRKLEDVLSRKEFQSAKPRGLLEIWTDKVKDWIVRMLDKLLGKIPSRQSRNDTLAWIIIAIAVCILAVWIKRNAKRREPQSVRIPIPFSPSERGWRTWLADARAAAAENRWREAVHLAYWAGISHLEEGGAWIPDRARTPREYLQLISKSHPRHRELLALTRRIEVTWYGNEEAAASDFSEALQHLEVLGCR